MQVLTLKNGDVKKGFWNGKVYGQEGNQAVYFNESRDGTKNGINWKSSLTINRSDISSIKTVDDTAKPVVTKVCPKCRTYCMGDCGK